MDTKVAQKSDVNLDRLAKVAFIAMRRNGLLAEDVSEEAMRGNVSRRMADHAYDWVFLVEDHGAIVGWLAFYEMADSAIAQIWNWHPVVLPSENESEIAGTLIQEALSHLQEIDVRRVAIDFQVTGNTQSCLDRYLGWYAQAGVTRIIEEAFYKRSLTEEQGEVSLPEEYSVGYVSETALERLFSCWLEVFSSSDDQVFQSLDAAGRRDLFFESWSRKKPLIDEASFTLYHRGRLIGFSRVIPMYESTDGYLAPIGILPEYRRRGLARELLKMSMLRLTELSYQTASCYVSTSNAAAVSFYERLGFVSKYRITSLFGELG
jgi:ribosomal protein S18 acetylase RimI-like enzyme